MRGLKFRRLALTLVTASLGFTAPLHAEEPAGAKDAAKAGANEGAKKIADLEVKLDDKLAPKGADIRTMFIVLYDADSAAPMPYGALKVELDKAAKGTFYKGTLTTENVYVMGGGALPKTVRIKARLDKEGNAGGDKPGDLVGIADKVTIGSKATITINKAI
jgi:hypothetical protein